MKNLLFVFALINLSFSTFAQENVQIKAFVSSHEKNEIISLQDLLKADKIQLSEPDYIIVSYKIAFKENNFVVSISSQSEMITQEMKQKLKNRRDNENLFSLYVEEIKVKSKKGETFFISPTKYKVKTE